MTLKMKPETTRLGVKSKVPRRVKPAQTAYKARTTCFTVNPFSSSSYSAVQFTARTLIRLPNPTAAILEKVQSRFQRVGRPEIGDLLHIPELIQEQEEFTFFFAHEVQVMERSGFESIVSGPASHTEYKFRQREAVRRRVLQGIAPQEASC